ncbi:MAG: DUF488 domain-containing protein [Rhodospirillaceae bacterium]
MTSPAIIFTIGYAGSAIGPFLDALKAAGVAELVDVRAVPASRNRPFSKTALAAALNDAGIAYRHLKALGTPKEGRDAAKRGDTATMRRIYDTQLARPEAQDALAALRALAIEERVALMCMESDPANCHRSIVAARLGTEFVVEHLQPIHRV